MHEIKTDQPMRVWYISHVLAMKESSSGSRSAHKQSENTNKDSGQNLDFNAC